jgi:hypothetical protein
MIMANVLDISRGQVPIPDPNGEKSHPPSARRLQRRDGFAITASKQNAKSP